VGVTRPGRFPSVARSTESVNPEIGGKTGRNPPPSPARGEVRLGDLLDRFVDTGRGRNGDESNVELDLPLGEHCLKDNLLEVDQCRGSLFSAHPQKGAFPAV
jgi:hypothetical protein